MRWTLLASLAVALLVGFIALLVWSYGAVYDEWSRLKMKPVVERAENLSKSDPAGAVALLQRSLAEHPDNPRLLYEMAALRFDHQEPVLGVFYAIAYLRSSRDQNPRRVKTLRSLLMIDPSLYQYLADDNYASNDERACALFENVPENELSAWNEYCEKGPAPLAPPVRSLAAELHADEQLFLQLPGDWQRSVRLPPAEVLSPAHAHIAGYIEMAAPDTDKGHYMHEWPRLYLARGDLWDAVRTGGIDIPTPEAGAGCCQLKFDDPQLRPLEQVVSDYAQAHGGIRRLTSSAKRMASLLGLREQVALKQLYLLNFAVSSWAPGDASAKNKPLVTHYAGGAYSIERKDQ